MNEAAHAPLRSGHERTVAWLTGAALVATLLIPIERLLSAHGKGLLAYDFRQTFLPAAEALLDGRSPYPEYGYPPLVAFLSVPFAIAPAVEITVTAALVAMVPASLWLFGVRDWRSYAAAFLWVSTFNAVQTGNVTLPLLLGLAVCWRFRDNRPATAIAGGLTLAAKLVTWPILIWLASTRRLSTAVAAIVVGALVTLGLWATLGFAGLLSYPESLDRLQEQEGEQGYTLQAMAMDAGLPGIVGQVLGAAVAVAALACVVVFGRRRDDARSFACAIAATVVASPIVWLHSFVLLLGPLAVLRPRFGWLWLLPAGLWFTSPGTGNGAPWQTAVTLAVAAILVVEPLRHPSLRDRRWTRREMKTSEVA